MTRRKANVARLSRYLLPMCGFGLAYGVMAYSSQGAAESLAEGAVVSDAARPYAAGPNPDVPVPASLDIVYEDGVASVVPQAEPAIGETSDDASDDDKSALTDLFGGSSPSELLVGSTDVTSDPRFTFPELPPRPASSATPITATVVVGAVASDMEEDLPPAGMEIAVGQPAPVVARVETALNAADPDLAARISQAVARNASLYDAVEPALVRAVIHVESAGNPSAISAKGAMGLMQLMPATAERHGVTNPFDVDDNIAGGVAELAHLFDKYDNIGIALAAYNAGEGAVDTYDGIPPFAETRDYVVKVLSRIYLEKQMAEAAVKAPALPDVAAPEPEEDERIARKMGIYEFDRP